MDNVNLEVFLPCNGLTGQENDKGGEFHHWLFLPDRGRGFEQFNVLATSLFLSGSFNIYGRITTKRHELRIGLPINAKIRDVSTIGFNAQK